MRECRATPTLLHLDSSMRHEGSRSRALSAHFAAAWQQANPDGPVVYRDLAADQIPHLDLTAFSANFVADNDRTAAQREARKLTETLANELLRADEVVIGIPLYNFGPPSPENRMGRAGIEPATLGLKVPCSTN